MIRREQRAQSLSAGGHLDVPGYFVTAKPLLMALLSDKQYHLLNAIVQSDPDFKFGGNPLLQQHIIQLYSAHGCLQSVLRHFFLQEIKETTDPCTLFRGASLATAIFSGHFHLNSKQYIRKLTLPLISAICSSDRSWAVNPDQEPDPDALKRNAEDIKILTAVFLDRIFDANRNLPNSITSVLSFIDQEIKKKFGSDAYDLLPSFFFLRFICPVIVSPERFGIVTDPPATKTRRGLVVVTKILQQLAINESFGDEKGPYMCQFNPILDKYREPFAKFSQTLKSGKIDSEFALSDPLNPKDHDNALDFFATVIENCLPQICSMIEDKDPETAEFLKENFGCSTALPDLSNLSESPDKLEKGESLLGKARKRLRRASLHQMVTPTVNDAQQVFSLGVQRKVNFSGQLVVLKELLRDETRNRQQTEDDLAAARKRLNYLQLLEKRCNCK